MEKEGFYQHTAEELEYGAKLAWRNSNRCIGRLSWQSLHVIDKRDIETEEEMIAALFEHINYATNEGRIGQRSPFFLRKTSGFEIISSSVMPDIKQSKG